MKKLMVLFLGILLFACQKQIVPIKSRSATVTLTDVNIGTTANDGTGDALRTAFQKVNANNALIEAAIATASTTTEVRGYINDSIDALKELAVPLSSVAFAKADSNKYGEASTRNWVENYVAANGGTGSGGYEWTEFIVGTTAGAPANADTAFTIADMAGDVIELYRGTTLDLHKQWLNETATNGKTGYRYNSAGQIVVRPAWATNDRAYVKGVASSAVSKITLAGGESTLLTGLRAYWDMDETTGTAVNDYLDTYDGVTNATVGVTGKFGLAENFVRANSDVATFGTTVGDVGTSDFSIACWVYIDNVTTEVEQGIMGNWGGGPHWYLEYNYGKAMFYFSFGSGGIEVSSNSELAADTWIHLAVTVDRSGNATLYVNGSAQTDVESVAADVAVAGDNNNIFNIGNLGNSNINMYANFTIDEVGLWLKVLTTDEINELIAGSL